MIFAWLTAKGLLGLKKGWWLLIALAALALVIVLADRWMDRTIETAKVAGATEQREGDLRETIERTEKANEAREDIRLDRGNARYDECLRTARTPANCERFLSSGEADNR